MPSIGNLAVLSSCWTILYSREFLIFDCFRSCRGFRPLDRTLFAVCTEQISYAFLLRVSRSVISKGFTIGICTHNPLLHPPTGGCNALLYHSPRGIHRFLESSHVRTIVMESCIHQSCSNRIPRPTRTAIRLLVLVGRSYS